MSLTTILIYSLTPILIIALFIYNRDKNKEPSNIIVKLILGGVLSAIITIVLTYILGMFYDNFLADFENLSGIDLIIHAFISVALIEEFSKWILTRIICNNKECDEPFDYLLYGAFIALGFAAFENIIYVAISNTSTALLRAFTAVPLHAILGLIMGYNLLQTKENNKNILLSILIPTLIHGIYDYGIMSLKYIQISYLIAFLCFIYAMYILKKVSNLSPNKKIHNIKNNFEEIIYSEIYCPNCGQQYKNNYCTICGRRRK